MRSCRRPGDLPGTSGSREILAGAGSEPSWGSAAWVVLVVVLDRLVLPELPTLQGKRVILRGHRESDADDRLRHPIDPEEEDGYGSAWRREWDGRRYHTREHLTAGPGPLDPARRNARSCREW
jgi:hypothetical protein